MNALRTALGVGLAVALVAPAGASAAPMVDSSVLSLSSQSLDLGSYQIHDSNSFGITFVDYNLWVASSAKWTGTLPLNTSWNSTNVRQGATLAVGRASTPLTSGKIRVTWKLKG